MGVATGCVFKEVYRFLHTTYPYSCSFLQQHPYFLLIFLNVFRSLVILIVVAGLEQALAGEGVGVLFSGII